MAGPKAETSVDSTCLDSGNRSTHYAYRTGQKCYQLRDGPKRTLACHNATHLLIKVLISDGPTQDAPMLDPVLKGVCRRANVDDRATLWSWLYREKNDLAPAAAQPLDRRGPLNYELL